MNILFTDSEFKAPNVSYWRVGESELTVVVNADLPLGQVRREMRHEVTASNKQEVTLPQTHATYSFLGVLGTDIHGRSWRLHKPRSFVAMDVWQCLDFASAANWTGVDGEPPTLPSSSQDKANPGPGIDLADVNRRAFLSRTDRSLPPQAPTRAPTISPHSPEVDGHAKVTRAFSGLQIDGASFSVLIVAECDGQLGIRVTANPLATPLPFSLNVTREQVNQVSFALPYIKINGAVMECFAPSTSTPLFLTGFKVVLETAVAKSIAAWLPNLGLTAAIAALMARAVDEFCTPNDQVNGKPAGAMDLDDLHSFIADLAAQLVLDQKSPAAALAHMRATHWIASQPRETLDDKSARFLQAFDTEALQAIMRSAVSH